MIEALYYPFYLALLVAVLGCFIYLYRTRGPSRPWFAWFRWRLTGKEPEPSGRELHSKLTPLVAAAIRGTYALGELGRPLKKLAEAEAWGEVVDIQLPSQQSFAQLILIPEGVEFASHGVGVDLERFREEAAKLSLTPRALSGPTYYSSPRNQGKGPEVLLVEVFGEWTEVASKVIQLIKGIYGTGEQDTVEVSTFAF